ncbi:MAG: site-specific DNA-methyltransferase [Proteobacteria bacterium]|nr:site-specific DNA-methyltransferase [Pseudomonadota bacterium]MBU4381606.1 site-specific DNA-methyltransferase [Pseudomonadota bacterium]MCG2766593.1 site-specific DNA-methyltransferase [Desulfarculaceae bacterium]
MVRSKKPDNRQIETYEHQGKKRVNNPPVGLVTPETDPDESKATYSYDPHLDPQLVWAGKAEHTSFEVPTVSLHVHERIDPRTIIEAVRKKNGSAPQPSLFASQEENLPIRQAIEFYKHKHGWSNRLIAGDSLLVMNSLLEKEGMAGQLQMVYVDPPYGIKYRSNFQPFTNNKSVSDSDKDVDLTQEPEMLKAFRDTWECGIHSYLSYLRDRLKLAHRLLSEEGSCFVQISDENLHLTRMILDEIFGSDNFVGQISFVTKIPLRNKYLPGVCDYILWYGKDFAGGKLKFRNLFEEQSLKNSPQFSLVELDDGSIRTITQEEVENPDILPAKSRVFTSLDLASSGRTESCVFDFTWEGKSYSPTAGKSWKTNLGGMDKLAACNRLYATKTALRYRLYFDDYPVKSITNNWTDTVGVSGKIYVVQTDIKVIKRCMLMCTDPGDIVFDPTCGSGTTPFVAEQWGRRWITCDTSRVAISLAKQRLATAIFDYFELKHPNEGVDSGFNYHTVPHITLGSITQNSQVTPSESLQKLKKIIRDSAKQEVLFDQPIIDSSKARVTGPFTVEAVPAPAVLPIDQIDGDEKPADESVSRSGESLRQEEWRDELYKTGVRGKGGQRIEFSRVEPLPGTRWLHADAETKEDQPQRVVVSFGPEYAPLEQRQVDLALEEAQSLVPKPKIIIFASFQFDSEAAKDIEETNWPGVTLLKAQMNADLLTEDLKKKRASNESFWLIGQPDVDLKQVKKGDDKGKWQVDVHGFDYYNTRKGIIESGGKGNIAMWMLDTDYDGRSLLPRQVFFPMASAKEGWAKLAKSLKAEIDEDLIEAYRGTVSLPFEPGAHRRVAVKIVDDRGIESLKIIGID